MSPTSDSLATDFQIGVYKARAIAALDEYCEEMNRIFKAAYDKLPQYIKDQIPPYELISNEDELIVADLNERCEKKFLRMKKEIEKRYGFKIQDDSDGYGLDFFIVQILPDGSALWYSGADFDIDSSWVKA
jgi:hypothetical protein